MFDDLIYNEYKDFDLKVEELQNELFSINISINEMDDKIKNIDIEIFNDKEVLEIIKKNVL